MQCKHLYLDQQISIFLPCRKDHTSYEKIGYSNIIKKERFFLEVEKKSWIIDCFKETNYPLEIAEIELSNEEEDLSLPSFISKEITGMTHYSNFSLANNPFSDWGKDYLTTFKSN